MPQSRKTENSYTVERTLGRIHHAKIGNGVIVNLQGSGTQGWTRINSGRNGMKLLDLGVAKLERVA